MTMFQNTKRRRAALLTALAATVAALTLALSIGIAQLGTPQAAAGDGGGAQIGRVPASPLRPARTSQTVRR